MTKSKRDGWLTDLWYVAFPSASLRKGKMVVQEICGLPILFTRNSQGKPSALLDICPHRAAPLSAGRLLDAPATIDPDVGKTKGDCIECPYHGWKFDLGTGKCVEIPSLTKAQSAHFETERMAVQRFELCEMHGLIWIFIPSSKQKIPEVEPVSLPISPKRRPKMIDQAIFSCALDHAVIGLMDPAHGPFVHSQWWWRSAHSIHEKEKQFEPRELGFAMAAHRPSSNSRAYRLIGGQPQTEISFALPGLRWEFIRNKENWVLALTCLTPINQERTRIYQLFYSNYWLFSVLKPVIRGFARRFLHQDRHMVDLQQTRLGYDPNLKLIEDADMQAKWYYQLKKEWYQHRAEKRDFANPVTEKKLRWRS